MRKVVPFYSFTSRNIPLQLVPLRSKRVSLSSMSTYHVHLYTIGGRRRVDSGCDSWQPVESLDRHNREAHTDRTLAPSLVVGLVWRPTLSPLRPHNLRRPLEDTGHRRHPDRSPVPPPRVVRLHPDAQPDLARVKFNRFFAHLEHDLKDRRTELRLVLDVTGPAGNQLVVMPIHPEKGGVAGGVEAMLREAANQFPVTMNSLRVWWSSSPATFHPWSPWSSTSARKPPRSRSLVPGSECRLVPAPEDEEVFADLRPGSPKPVGGRVSPGACSQAGVVGA